MSNLNIFENLQELIIKKVKHVNLNIKNTPNLNKIRLYGLSNLKKIYIEKCKNFKQLDFNKEQTPSLSTIIIKDCKNFNISTIDDNLQKFITIEQN